MKDALATYGNRQEIRELKDRLVKMLPSVKEVGETGALALAQVALALDLNPFLGEVWAIPQKGGTFSLMAGIKGLRRAAHQIVESQGGHYQLEFQRFTKEQREAAELKEGDIGVACRLEVWTPSTRETFRMTGEPTVFAGWGIFRKGESTRMEPVMVARKRAEADALKQAFDLPFKLHTELPPGEWQVEEAEILEETQGPGSVARDMADLYGEERKPALPSEETEEEFIAEVLAKIPFYRQPDDVRSVLTFLGFRWDPANSDKLFEMLDDHAQKRTPEKGAQEQQSLFGPEEEKIPF